MKNLIRALLLAIGLASCVHPPELVHPPPTLFQTPTLSLPATSGPTPTLSPTSATSYPTATPYPTSTPLPGLGTGQPVRLTSLNILDTQTGWGIESTGHIVRTTDGGSTWQDVSPDSEIFTPNSFFALDARHAWAISPNQLTCPGGALCYSAFIWRTSDGGETWHQRSMPISAHYDFAPISLQFLNDKSGRFFYVDFFGMSGTTYMDFVASEDGGDSWTNPNQVDYFCPSVMFFLNDQNGWEGEDCRSIQAIVPPPWQDFLDGKITPELEKTNDGGRSWDPFPMPAPTVFPTGLTQSSASPIAGELCGVSSLKQVSSQGFLVEWNCSDGYIYDYLTTDQGQTWHTWLATGNESFINAATGWRMFTPGSGQLNQLQQTTDGGLTWKTIQKVAWPNVQFDFIDEQNGWAIVTGGDGTQAALVHTVDGGKNWVEIKPKAAHNRTPTPCVICSTPVPTASPTPTPLSMLHPGWTLYSNANGLANKDFCFIAVAPDGSMWFATDSGVSHFDGKSWAADGPANYDVTSIAVAPDGTVWAGTGNGVWHFDGKSWKNYTSADGLAEDVIFSIAVAPDGTVWAGTMDKGISRFDGKSWKTYTSTDGLAGNIVFSIAVAPDGTVWAGTDNGASRFDGKSWKNYTSADGLVGNNVHSIAVAPDGVLWFGTADGVSRFDGTAWTSYDSTNGLAVNNVLSIAVAPDGVLWFGTVGGVTRFDGTIWKTYTSADGMLDTDVSSVAVAPDGALWVGTWSGVSRYQPQN